MEIKSAFSTTYGITLTKNYSWEIGIVPDICK